VRSADQRALISLVHAAISRFGTVRVLIRVQRYAGPHHDWRFDPDGLCDAAGEGIFKLAVVGEPAWKTVAPMSGRRPRALIEYFATEQAARCWLVEGCARTGRGPALNTRGVRRRVPEVMP
jgi:hypothetical protein